MSQKEEQLVISRSNSSQSHDASNSTAETNTASATISESAYQEAWASLDESQRQELKGAPAMQVLLEKFQEEDQSRQDNSLLRKGLKATDPYLKKLASIIDLASPFVSLNAPAGTAVGLLKGVVSVSQAHLARVLRGFHISYIRAEWKTNFCRLQLP